jgi:hypothetical protein
MDVRLDVGADEWRDAVRSLPPDRQDVYFGPAFHAVHAAHGDGIPHCSIVREADAMLVVPGLRREVDDRAGLWDLQTCRTGCAGPLANEAADAEFLERAWSAWAAEMSASGAVAAFFRLHPLIGNDRWLPRSAEVREDRLAVVVDLAAGCDAAWQAASARHRNMVRKAQSLGVSVSWNTDRASFERLYADAMERLGADPELKFGKPFFAALWTLPEIDLATVVAGGTLVAGAVAVWGGQYGHYLFAARRPDAGNHLSNLLIDAIVERAVEHNVRVLYLGGGKTTSRDDRLLRFKQSAGTRLVAYHVALVHVDEPARLNLVNAWRDRTGQAPTWLLGYRQPDPAIDRRNGA